MNTSEFLEIANAICPEKTAIIFEDKRYTFSQLNERVNRLAHSLQKLGVKKGERVALLQVNCNQCVETYFAVVKLRAIYVPLNFQAKGQQLTFILNNSEAHTLLVGARYLEIINSNRQSLSSLRNLISIDKKLPDLSYYEDLIATGPSEDVFNEIDDDDTTIPGNRAAVRTGRMDDVGGKRESQPGNAGPYYVQTAHGSL